MMPKTEKTKQNTTTTVFFFPISMTLLGFGKQINGRALLPTPGTARDKPLKETSTVPFALLPPHVDSPLRSTVARDCRRDRQSKSQMDKASRALVIALKILVLKCSKIFSIL